MEYYSAIKSEIMSFAASWMGLGQLPQPHQPDLLSVRIVCFAAANTIFKAKPEMWTLSLYKATLWAKQNLSLDTVGARADRLNYGQNKAIPLPQP